MSCQLRFPRARSPNAFVNSVRAARKGLESASADDGVPTPSALRGPPSRSVRRRGRRRAIRVPIGRMGASAQRAERVGDAEACAAGEMVGDAIRDPDGEHGEDEGTAHNLKERTR